MKLKLIDVELALMNAQLKEEIHINAPPGTLPITKGYVYILKRSLHGLMQSPKKWNFMVTVFMVKECEFPQL